jgi:hypothetical protein
MFKGIVSEVLGKQIEIDKNSSYLTEMIIKNILKHDMEENEIYKIPFGCFTNEEFIEKTGIGKVVGVCDFSYSEKEKFVKKFYNFLGNKNIKQKNSDFFFKKWNEHINNNGRKLYIKIMKLVADKFNKKEEDVINETFF